MNLGTLIHEAITNLLSNKVRSLLTMLGIFIGIGAVIAMMSVGLGAKKSITDQMSALGADTLYIFPGNFTQTVRNAGTLTNEDANAIAALDCIDNISPTSSAQLTVSRAGKQSSTLTVTGVFPTYLKIENYSLAEGRFITQADLDNNAMVTVIGSDTRDLMFETYEEAVGNTVRIGGQPYEVVGVLKSKGDASMISSDRGVYVPLTTAQNRLITRQKHALDQIAMKINPAYSAEAAEAAVTALMRDRHDILSGEPDDFSIFNMQEIVDTMNSVMNSFVIFLGSVAGISLLVGGIGIMNIMLVTVTERTKEIGLRKALGAKNRDIQLQFLVESSVLSLIGGIFGIIFG
ncbi:MAG TPA: ABC transporter permease, partial [Flexilinea sp.]|nr:ABC transporter permease [Flexilinea sp.]